MKKYLVLSIIMIFALVFVSCSGNGDDEPMETATPVVTDTPESTDTPVPTDTPEPTAEPTPMPTTEPGTGEHAGEIISDEPITVDFYPNQWHDQDAVAITGSLAIQFFATTSFDKVGVIMPTWGATSGHAATISLYAWQGSYDRTMLSDPITFEEFSDWEDGADVALEFDEPLVDGEYLIEIYNEETPNVGVWYKIEEIVDYVRVYMDDEVWEDGPVRMFVNYTKTPTDVHGPIQESGF